MLIDFIDSIEWNHLDHKVSLIFIRNGKFEFIKSKICAKFQIKRDFKDLIAMNYDFKIESYHFSESFYNTKLIRK